MGAEERRMRVICEIKCHTPGNESEKKTVNVINGTTSATVIIHVDDVMIEISANELTSAIQRARLNVFGE